MLIAFLIDLGWTFFTGLGVWTVGPNFEVNGLGFAFCTPCSFVLGVAFGSDLPRVAKTGLLPFDFNSDISFPLER
jgi:hypothetical protein